MNNKKLATKSDKFKALRLAEIQLTDKEDFNSCVKDMTRSASLDKSEAKVVANAIRSKYLPNILKEAGLEDLDVKPMVKKDDVVEETADFVEDTDDDNEEDMYHFEDGEEDLDEDLDEDNDEAEDDEMAKFEIEVPADMVDAAKQAVQEALDNLLGGEDDMDMEDEDMDDEMDSDEDEMDDDMDDEDDMDKIGRAHV